MYSGLKLLFQKSFVAISLSGMFLCLHLHILLIVGLEDWSFDSMDVEASQEDEQEQVQEACQELPCILSLGGYYKADSVSPWSWSRQGRQVLYSVIC
jgi:hypothetical protein